MADGIDTPLSPNRAEPRRHRLRSPTGPAFGWSVLLALLVAVALGAQTPPPERPPAQTPAERQAEQPPAEPGEQAPVEPRPEGVPLIWEGREILRVYGPQGPLSAEDRVRLGRERLERLIRENVPPESLTVRHLETQSEFYAGERLVALVSDADAAAAGRPRIEIADDMLATLRQVIATAEAERSARGRITQALKGGAATLLLVAILLGIRLVSRRLRGLIDARVRTRQIRLQQAELVSGQRLAGLLAAVVRTAVVLLGVIAIIAWFQAVLLVLPLTRGMARAVAAYVADPLLFVGDAIVGFVPNVFYLLVIAGVTWLALKGIHAVFRELGRGTIRSGEFRPEWAEPTYKIVRVLVLALAVVAAFPYIPGSSSPAFQGVSLFLGLLVSLSSSSAIANVIAGTMLTYTDAFREGDRVRIGDTTGDVTRKAMLVTRVRTVKNEVVSIPNAVVLTSAIVNYTRLADERGLILHTSVTIGYDAPWRTVHELLVAAARATDGVLAEPPPFVLQTSLDDFYVSYELNAYTRDAGRIAQLYSELHANIQDRFNEAGVEIMSPHFSALRDANAPAMPDTPPGPRPAPGIFSIPGRE